MLQSFHRIACTFAIITVGAASLPAQDSSYDLLPEKTQAALWLPHAEKALSAWNNTELAKLATDKSIAPFFEEKRKEIEGRFMEAGWRLSVQPEDIGDYSTGQLLLGWAAVDHPPKPYTLMMVADVEDDEKQNAELLARIDEELKEQKAEKANLSHAGTDIVKYVLPRRPGELIKQSSYVAIKDGSLLATDDEAMIKELIDRVGGTLTKQQLSAEADFVKSRELAKLSGNADVEFFVRPLGFARIIRSIAGTRSKSDTDMLVALERQGFKSISAISGEFLIGNKDLDVEYNGYVYAKKPFDLSAKVLDFPNQASNEIPAFIGDKIASLIVTNWNAKDAFWTVEGLVDEITGTEGVFAEVIDGIKLDPNGPQIDIRKILPLFTNDIFSVSDTKEGDAEVDSRRNLMAFKLTDPAVLSKVLNRAMRGEPDAKEIEFKGHTIWAVSHNSTNELEVPPDFEFGGLDDDFGDFGPPRAQGNGNDKDEDHWLNSWAITVHGNYLVFASHIDLIKESIERSLQTDESPIYAHDDYQRVMGAIHKFHGSDPVCAWRVLFPKEAYRVQYELFRQGKLSESQSMLATILDRLLQTDDEIEDKVQKINGQGLPDFSTIEKYLQPGGFSIRTRNDGWSFGGMILSKNFQELKKKAPEPKDDSEFETARSPQDTSTGARR
ncbi:MAG: hypothetical protein AAF483_27560 [Planctomycetota bacterium]